MVRDVLDESSASFWTDAQLLRYLNRAKDRVWSRIRELKDDWEAKKVPIVVFSNYPNRLNASQREKVEAVVAKPADMEELVGELQRAIAKGQSN